MATTIQTTPEMIDLCSSSSDSDGLKPSMKRKRPTVSTSNKSNKQSSADSSDNDIECVGVKPPSPKKPSYGDLPRQATPTSNSNSNSNPKPKSKLKTANEKRKKLDTASSGRNDLGGGKKLRSPKSDGRRSSSPPGSSSGWWTEKPTTVKKKIIGKSKSYSNLPSTSINKPKNQKILNTNRNYGNPHSSLPQFSHGQSHYNQQNHNISFEPMNAKDAEAEQEALFEKAKINAANSKYAPQADNSASAFSSRPGSGFQPSSAFSTVMDIKNLPPDHWKYIDLYARLGVPTNCTTDQIKKQYRKLALLYHPDKCGGGGEKCGGGTVGERFEAVKHAYETLTNKF